MLLIWSVSWLNCLHDYFVYNLYLISYLSLLLPYMIDVFLQYSYLLLSTFICLLLFTNTTFPCYCYYCTIPLHFEYKITRMSTCRRSDHQKINRKKCTIIKLWKSGTAEADFVVGWTIRESIQRNVLLSNFENQEEQRRILLLVGPS